MERKTLYLARHGETAWNRENRLQGHTDIPLNERGREQARALAAAVRERIFTVGSSDLRRARETAEIVAAARGLVLSAPDPDLRERMFGDWEGLTREDCAARFPEEWARYRADPRRGPPHAESHADFMARARRGLSTALHSAEGSPLVISHGGLIRALYAEITDSSPPPVRNGEFFALTFEGEQMISIVQMD